MARTKVFDENEVLRKAVCLFWDKGYNGTSMQDLVNGLGISRSSLYDTFGDKHQLYLKALESYRQQHGFRFCSLIQEAPTAGIAVRQLLELLVSDLLSDQQRKGCFVVNAGVELAGHDPEVNALICENEQQLEEAFRKAIVRGQESGDIPAGKDALALARFLNNTVKGMQVASRSVTDPSFYEDIIHTALTLLH